MPAIVIITMCATFASGIACGLAISLLHDFDSYRRSRKIWRVEQ
jgi:hypothetical protein